MSEGIDFNYIVKYENVHTCRRCRYYGQSWNKYAHQYKHICKFDNHSIRPYDACTIGQFEEAE